MGLSAGALSIRPSATGPFVWVVLCSRILVFVFLYFCNSIFLYLFINHVWGLVLAASQSDEGPSDRPSRSYPDANSITGAVHVLCNTRWGDRPVLLKFYNITKYCIKHISHIVKVHQNISLIGGFPWGPKFVICDIIYVPPLQTTFSRTMWHFRHISFPHKTAPSRATKPLFKELVIIFPFAGSVEQLWWAWHYERSRFMLRWILFILHLPHSSELISQNQAHALFRQLQAQF